MRCDPSPRCPVVSDHEQAPGSFRRPAAPARDLRPEPDLADRGSRGSPGCPARRLDLHDEQCRRRFVEREDVDRPALANKPRTTLPGGPSSRPPRASLDATSTSEECVASSSRSRPSPFQLSRTSTRAPRVDATASRGQDGMAFALAELDTRDRRPSQACGRPQGPPGASVDDDAMARIARPKRIESTVRSSPSLLTRALCVARRRLRCCRPGASSRITCGFLAVNAPV